MCIAHKVLERMFPRLDVTADHVWAGSFGVTERNGRVIETAELIGSEYLTPPCVLSEVIAKTCQLAVRKIGALTASSAIA